MHFSHEGLPKSLVPAELIPQCTRTHDYKRSRLRGHDTIKVTSMSADQGAAKLPTGDLGSKHRLRDPICYFPKAAGKNWVGFRFDHKPDGPNLDLRQSN